MNNNTAKIQKISSITGALLINFLSRPSIYWGNLTVYVMSYHVAQGVGHSTSTTTTTATTTSTSTTSSEEEMSTSSLINNAWFFVFYNLGWAITMLLVDVLTQHVSPKYPILVGVLVFNSAFFLSAFSGGFVSWRTYVCVFSFVIGMGLGLFEALVLKYYVVEWAGERHKGFVTSLYMTSSSAGAAVANQFVTLWTNPDNLTPDLYLGRKFVLFSYQEICEKVPSMFLILGGTSTVLQLVGFGLLRTRHHSSPSSSSTSSSSSSSSSSLSSSSSSSSSSTAVTLTTGTVCNGDKKSTTTTLITVSSTQKPKLYNSFGYEPENKIGSNTPEHPENLSHRNTEEERDRDEIITNSDVSRFQKDVDVIDNTIAITDTEEGEIPTEINNVEDENEDEERDGTIWKYICNRDFQRLFFVHFLLSQMLEFSASFYKMYGSLWIKNDYFFSLLGTVMVIPGVFSNVILGICLDKFGLKYCFMVLSASLSMLSLLMYVSAILNSYLYFVITVLLYTFSSNMYFCAMASTVILFGKKHMSRNLALVAGAGMFSGLAVSSATDLLVNSYGWFGVFVWVASLSLVAFIVVTVSFPHSRRKTKT